MDWKTVVPNVVKNALITDRNDKIKTDEQYTDSF